MTAFSPGLRAAFIASHGIDPETSLREWLERLTGKTGANLDRLLADGAEVGRIIEEQERIARVQQGTQLTPAELRALEAFFEEGSVQAAADKIGISYWTVHQQLKFVRTRLGVHSTLAAVRVAIRTGQMAA